LIELTNVSLKCRCPGSLNRGFSLQWKDYKNQKNELISGAVADEQRYVLIGCVWESSLHKQIVKSFLTAVYRSPPKAAAKLIILIVPFFLSMFYS